MDAQSTGRHRARIWHEPEQVHDLLWRRDGRLFVHEYHLPERLDGLWVLDSGTWDGFWAWGMERRGAAEIRCIDMDEPIEVAHLPAPPGLLGKSPARRGSLLAISSEADSAALAPLFAIRIAARGKEVETSSLAL